MKKPTITFAEAFLEKSKDGQQAVSFSNNTNLYTTTEELHAIPYTYGEYCRFTGTEISNSTIESKDGYMIRKSDSKIIWLPKEYFESNYVKKEGKTTTVEL